MSACLLDLCALHISCVHSLPVIFHKKLQSVLSLAKSGIIETNLLLFLAMKRNVYNKKWLTVFFYLPSKTPYNITIIIIGSIQLFTALLFLMATSVDLSIIWLQSLRVHGLQNFLGCPHFWFSRRIKLYVLSDHLFSTILIKWPNAEHVGLEVMDWTCIQE
jgi:hypothetical protein